MVRIKTILIGAILTTYKKENVRLLEEKEKFNLRDYVDHNSSVALNDKL